MPIQTIKRDVTYSPAIVRITTTNTLSTVGSAGYITSQASYIYEVNQGEFQWYPTDVILVNASDGWAFFTISSDFSTLNILNEPGAGTVTSVGYGTGLTSTTSPNPITSTGTLSFAPIAANSFWANVTGSTAVPTVQLLSTISPLTTKGDLYTFSTFNDRLPVGTDGQILTANSAQSTGLEWVTRSSSITFAGDSGQGTSFTTNSPVIQAGLSSLNCGSSVWFDATSPNITLNLTDANANTILGQYSGNSGLVNAGANLNTVIGSESFVNITGVAENNIIIGYATGQGYSTNESGNILIGGQLPGIPSENNITRIGFITGIPSQLGCYIDGINIANSIGFTSPKVVYIDSSTGQLGYGASFSQITFAGDSGQGTPFTTNSPVIQAGFSSQLCGSSVWFDATSPNITLNLSDSNSNTILGSYSGTSGLLGSGGGANTVIGSGSFDSVNGPATNNILIGFSVANAYTNQESGNIIISNSFPGTPGQNNTTVIGFSGNTPTTTACYIDGINSVDSSGFTSPKVVYVDSSTGQLGYGSSTSATLLNYNAVVGTYNVLLTDQFIGCRTGVGAITIQLPNSPPQGSVWYIKDSNGNAAINNITITTVGGAVAIDGVTSYVISTNYQSIAVIFDSNNLYEVF